MDEEATQPMYFVPPWYVRFRRAFWRAFWRRLGFNPWPVLQDLPPELGEAINLMNHMETIVYLSRRDRLRLIISGRLMVRHRVRTNVPVIELHAESAVGVVPPGEKY
jgi:hypothetical protein